MAETNDDSFQSQLLNLPCQHIRSKEMFYQNLESTEDEFCSGLYWCGKTHEGFGPDGEPVARGSCRSGRGCFSG